MPFILAPAVQIIKLYFHSQESDEKRALVRFVNTLFRAGTGVKRLSHFNDTSNSGKQRENENERKMWVRKRATDPHTENRFLKSTNIFHEAVFV